MPDDSSVLLTRAGQKSGNIFEGDKGDVESIAKTYKSCTLDGSIDVKTTLKINDRSIKRLFDEWRDEANYNATHERMISIWR